MRRLLADENIPSASVRSLRAAGHDVVAIGEEMRRAPDLAVLARATAEGRLLITFDRDFGVLAFREMIRAPAGIVLLRFRPVSPGELASVLHKVIESSDIELRGKFTVVTRHRIRQRSMRGPG